jgi:hypothetical protein
MKPTRRRSRSRRIILLTTRHLAGKPETINAAFPPCSSRLFAFRLQRVLAAKSFKKS